MIKLMRCGLQGDDLRYLSALCICREAAPRALRARPVARHGVRTGVLLQSRCTRRTLPCVHHVCDMSYVGLVQAVCVVVRGGYGGHRYVICHTYVPKSYITYDVSIMPPIVAVGLWDPPWQCHGDVWWRQSEGACRGRCVDLLFTGACMLERPDGPTSYHVQLMMIMQASVLLSSSWRR